MGRDVIRELEAVAVEVLRRVLEAKGYPAENILLERPPAELGVDLAFPCFQLAKEAHRPPNEIATEIMDAMELPTGFAACEAKGPYVNFIVDPGFLVPEVVKAIVSESHLFASGEKNGIKVIVEHTSANPTDQLHVGRGRNPIIGDTLARVLRKAGYDVETQYYVDDLGKQAATKYVVETEKELVEVQRDLVTSSSITNSPLFIGLPSSQQKEAEERRNLVREQDKLSPYAVGSTVSSLEESFLPEFRDRKLSNRIGTIVHSLEHAHPETTKAVADVVDRAMQETIIPTLTRLNISIDEYVHESRFMEPTREVIEDLKATGKVQEEENGANYLDLKEYGVSGRNTKFFITRGDGTSLYATRDIAYHLWKIEQVGEGGELVNILGEDHKLESKQIEVGLKLLESPKLPEVVFYAFVALPGGKMSTRKGRLVYMDDLIDEGLAKALEEVRKRREELSEEAMSSIAEAVGIGAIRYNILRVQPEKKIVFKWEEALNFEGGSAPFIQYAHARACSILSKAEAQAGDPDYGLLKDPSEVELAKALAKLPGLIQECGCKKRVHTLAIYGQEVASLFNAFYRDCPVLSASTDLTEARLALVDASREVLSMVLGLLGIRAPREM